MQNMGQRLIIALPLLLLLHAAASAAVPFNTNDLRRVSTVQLKELRAQQSALERYVAAAPSPKALADEAKHVRTDAADVIAQLELLEALTTQGFFDSASRERKHELLNKVLTKKPGKNGSKSSAPSDPGVLDSLAADLGGLESLTTDSGSRSELILDEKKPMRAESKLEAVELMTQSEMVLRQKIIQTGLTVQRQVQDMLHRPKNYVLCGGFETEERGWDVTLYWKTNECTEMRITPDRPHEGQHALEIRSTPPGNPASLWQTLWVPAGETYTFSFWARVEAGHPFRATIPGTSVNVPIDNAEWRQYTASWPAPEQNTWFSCPITFTGQGTLWLDAVQVEPGSEATAYEDSHARQDKDFFEQGMPKGFLIRKTEVIPMRQRLQNGFGRQMRDAICDKVQADMPSLLQRQSTESPRDVMPMLAGAYLVNGNPLYGQIVSEQMGHYWDKNVQRMSDRQTASRTGSDISLLGLSGRYVTVLATVYDVFYHHLTATERTLCEAMLEEHLMVTSGMIAAGGGIPFGYARRWGFPDESGPTSTFLNYRGFPLLIQERPDDLQWREKLYAVLYKLNLTFSEQYTRDGGKILGPVACYYHSGIDGTLYFVEALFQRTGINFWAHPHYRKSPEFLYLHKTTVQPCDGEGRPVPRRIGFPAISEAWASPAGYTVPLAMNLRLAALFGEPRYRTIYEDSFLDEKGRLEPGFFCLTSHFPLLMYGGNGLMPQLGALLWYDPSGERKEFELPQSGHIRNTNFLSWRTAPDKGHMHFEFGDDNFILNAFGEPLITGVGGYYVDNWMQGCLGHNTIQNSRNSGGIFQRVVREFRSLQAYDYAYSTKAKNWYEVTLSGFRSPPWQTHLKRRDSHILFMRPYYLAMIFDNETEPDQPPEWFALILHAYDADGRARMKYESDVLTIERPGATLTAKMALPDATHHRIRRGPLLSVGNHELNEKALFAEIVNGKPEPVDQLLDMPLPLNSWTLYTKESSASAKKVSSSVSQTDEIAEDLEKILASADTKKTVLDQVSADFDPTSKGADQILRLDRQMPYENEPSLCLTCYGMDTFCASTNVVPVVPGTRYRFSVRYRKENLVARRQSDYQWKDPPWSVAFRYFDREGKPLKQNLWRWENNNYLNSNWVAPDPDNRIPTQDWRLLEYETEAPKEAVLMYPVVRLSWVSDMASGKADGQPARLWLARPRVERIGSRQLTNRATFFAVLYPTPKGQSAPAMERTITANAALAKVPVPNATDYIFWRRGDQAGAAGPMESDGQVAVYRDGQGQELLCSLHLGSYLRFQGKELIKATGPLTLIVNGRPEALEIEAETTNAATVTLMLTGSPLTLNLPAGISRVSGTLSKPVVTKAPRLDHTPPELAAPYAQGLAPWVKMMEEDRDLPLKKGRKNLALGCKVTASGELGPRYSCSNVVDNQVAELPVDGVMYYDRDSRMDWSRTGRGYWLLPPKSHGWVNIDLGGEKTVSTVRILNTADAGYMTRATTKYHVEFIDDQGQAVMIGSGDFKYPYPVSSWQEMNCEPRKARHVRVVVDGYYLEGSANQAAELERREGFSVGGGLNEIQVFP